MPAAAENNGGGGGIAEAWTQRLAGNGIECEALSSKGLSVYATVEGSLWMFNIWDQAPHVNKIEAASRPCVTSALAFSAGGEMLASGSYDGLVYLWDVKANKEGLTETYCFAVGSNGDDAVIRSIVASPNGRFFAAFNGRCISIFDRSGNAVNRISLSGHGNHPVWLNCGTLTCTVDGDIYTWSDPTSTDLKHSVNVLKQSVLHGKSGTRVTATAGSNANDLALGFDDGTIIVYAEAEAEGKHGLQDVYTLSSPSGKVTNLVWDVSARYLIASGGGKMTIWDVDGNGAPSPVPCRLSSDVCKIVVHKRLPLMAASTVDGCMSFFLLSQKTGAPLMGPCPAAIHPQGGGKSAVQEEALGLLMWHQSGLIIAASETGAVTAWKVTGRAVADLLLNNLEQQADKGPMMPVQQAASSPVNGNGGASSSSASYGTATPVEGSPNSSPDTDDVVGNGVARAPAAAPAAGNGAARRSGANKGRRRTSAEEAPHTPEASPAGRPTRASIIAGAAAGDEAAIEGDGEALPLEGHPPPPPPLGKDSSDAPSGAAAVKKPPPAPLVAPVPSEGDATADDLEASPTDLQNTTASTPMSTASTAGSSSVATAATAGSVASSGVPSNGPVHLQHQQQMPQQPQHHPHQQGGRVYGGRGRGPASAPGGLNNGSRGHQGGQGPRSRRSSDSGHRDRDQHHGGGGWGGNSYHQGTQGNGGMVMGPYGSPGGYGAMGSAPPIHPVMPGAVSLVPAMTQVTPQQMQWYAQQMHYMQNMYQQAAGGGAAGPMAGGGSPYGAGGNSPMYGGPPHMAAMRGGAGAGGMMMPPQEHDPEAYQRHMMMMMQEGQQPVHERPVMQVSTLYVGNLAESVNEAVLEKTFSSFGQVNSCQVIKDKVTHASRGFGFVTFDNPFVAMVAMQSMNNKVMYGAFESRTLRVAPSNRAQRWGWGS